MPQVSMEKVRKTWIDWNNRLRKRQHLQPYILNEPLNVTAGNWSLYAAKRGFIDHKRTPQSSYYDYKGIEQWFADKGLVFANVNRTTFTENIGWGPLRCPATGDCTRQLISAMRSTFNFYLAERQKKEKPHYASLMNEDFKVIGLGIALSSDKKRYYLTVHYATRITSAPEKMCIGS